MICGALIDVDAGRPIYGITGITPTIGVSATAYEGRGVTLIVWPRWRWQFADTSALSLAVLGFGGAGIGRGAGAMIEHLYMGADGLA